MTTERDHVSDRKASNNKDMEGNKGGGRRDPKGQMQLTGRPLHITD